MVVSTIQLMTSMKTKPFFFKVSVNVYHHNIYNISFYVLFSEFLMSKGYTHTFNYSYKLINKTEMFWCTT